MKKFVALFVSMLLLASVCAMAESVPSKTVSDMTSVIINLDQSSETQPIVELDTTSLVEQELAKLAAAETVVAYFADVTNVAGEAIDLPTVIGADANDLEVHEFDEIVIKNVGEDCGKATITLQTPNTYAKDAKVVVLIGMSENGKIKWIAYDAIINEDGTVSITLDQDTILSVQSGTALLAVVGK